MHQTRRLRRENARVVPLPGGFSRAATVAMSLANTTVLFADRGESTSFPALVHRCADPVDAGVPADLEYQAHEDG